MLHFNNIEGNQIYDPHLIPVISKNLCQLL
jgi:hypothetical protein